MRRLRTLNSSAAPRPTTRLPIKPGEAQSENGLSSRGNRPPSLLEHLPQYLEHVGHGRVGKRAESLAEALAIDRA